MTGLEIMQILIPIEDSAIYTTSSLSCERRNVHGVPGKADLNGHAINVNCLKYNQSVAPDEIWRNVERQMKRI